MVCRGTEVSMAQPARSRMQVITYLLLVFAFSSFFYFLILHSGGMGYGRGMYVLGLMWCPALAGMLTLRINGRSISELGWKWGETKYQVLSWFIPLFYAAIAYSIVWIFRFGGFGNPEFTQSLTAMMHLGGPAWISGLLGIVLIGTYGLVRSISSGARRGDWVARFSGARAGAHDFLHQHGVDYRHRVVSVALPDFDLRRLQCGHSHVVLPDVLHGDGDCIEFHLRVDATEIREPMDRRDSARQP